MHICILTQYYPPEIGAPQARLSELVKSFIRSGHQVSVLTAMPNYPTGKIFPNYRGLYKSEHIDNAKVVRCYIFPSKSLSFIPRLWNYFSFVFSSIIIGFFTLTKVDVLISESPPLFLGISGYILSKTKGAKWIFNVSDLWPESAEILGIVKKGGMLNIAYALERFCYKNAWQVTGQSREIIQDINERFPEVKTYRLSNGVNIEMFSPENSDTELRKKLSTDDSCIAIYAGLHGVAQGLDQILYAAAPLPPETDLSIVLIGDGPEKEELIKLRHKLKLKNLRFLDPLPREDVPAMLASADIAIVPLKNRIKGAVPSKLYEAMSVGLAVVLIDEGEAAQIVKEANAGIVVQPGDIKSLSDALSNLAQDDKLRKDLGKNGIDTVRKRYNRHKINREFVKFLESEI